MKEMYPNWIQVLWKVFQSQQNGVPMSSEDHKYASFILLSWYFNIFHSSTIIA